MRDEVGSEGSVESSAIRKIQRAMRNVMVHKAQHMANMSIVLLDGNGSIFRRTNGEETGPNRWVALRYSYRGDPKVTAETISAFMREQVRQAMRNQGITITERDPWLEDYDHQKREHVFGIEGVRSEVRPGLTTETASGEWLEMTKKAGFAGGGYDPEYALTFAPISTKWRTEARTPVQKVVGERSGAVTNTEERMAQKIRQRMERKIRPGKGNILLTGTGTGEGSRSTEHSATTEHTVAANIEEEPEKAPHQPHPEQEKDANKI
jgi:hypothetical protein